MTPERAKGSASAIIRRSSVPERPAEELKKSTQTEVSTRINRDFSEPPYGRPSRYRCHGNEACFCGLLSGQADPTLDPRFRVSSSDASAFAPFGSNSHLC